MLKKVKLDEFKEGGQEIRRGSAGDMGSIGRSLDERLICQVRMLCIQGLDLLCEPARHAHWLKVPPCD